MSSPFASQLGTNYCPRDVELAQIKALLIEPCLKLKNLDKEIAVLRQALDKLTAERDALGAYVDAHKALLSPVRRLPLDIIELIFMACLPMHRNCVMSAQEAPVLLGRICSAWRAISLSTPQLWSRVHIVEPTPSNSVTSEGYSAKVAQRLEAADAWLRRSGTCPLSISLESKLSPGASPFMGSTTVIQPHASSPFLNVLLPFASRWQHMDLVLPPGPHEVLSRLTEENVPLLAHL
ncbi:F-box domain-containing protein [Mycena sanguinolenta]|uniref:F-box domain-containing protein n=1 Tax=Mycena sanguinolenta TaxID=230812 RepID=A0A8H6ZFU0_9AGAR|nr:F-box domain-containing protein [Mycena sanguinolenta]